MMRMAVVQGAGIEDEDENENEEEGAVAGQDESRLVKVNQADNGVKKRCIGLAGWYL
jgi:hypothetical protein